MSRVGPRPRERGSAAIWVVSCCAVLVLVAVAATVRGLAVVARHRAEAAAELAALAAAGQIGTGGAYCSTAARVARAEHAALSRCAVRLAPDGRSGTVAVSVAMTVRLPVVGAQLLLESARAARLPAAGEVSTG